MTDALVLSGGEIKGAYQAGVIQGLLENGYQPSIVTGISVGALNAAFIAAHQTASRETGKAMAEFWLERVTKPTDLAKRRPWWDVAWRVLRRDWDGLVDMAPMATMVRELLGPSFPVAQPMIRVQVGAVNLETGLMEYHACQSPTFMDAVLASAAEPFIMPQHPIAGHWYYDGGLRDIAPLRQAIAMGASRIVVVLCQAPGIVSFDPAYRGDALKVGSRIITILTNEVLENDIRQTRKINAMVRLAGSSAPLRLEGRLYSHIPVLVIRPKVGFTVDVSSFTARDIRQMVGMGYFDGTSARLEDAA